MADTGWQGHTAGRQLAKKAQENMILDTHAILGATDFRTYMSCMKMCVVSGRIAHSFEWAPAIPMISCHMVQD
eukprot:3036846-Amphidinium_carterae.2